jgi:hypothetical protein
LKDPWDIIDKKVVTESSSKRILVAAQNESWAIHSALARVS